MAGKIRAGVIGTGFMGSVHARAIQAAGATLSMVSGHSAESARRGAQTMGAAGVAESAEELITADDVDVVHICTPNHLHFALAEQALHAGKHVVCEKPLATTAADAQRLAELAANTDVVTAVPFVYRFYRPYARRGLASPTARRAGCGSSTAPTFRTGWPVPPIPTGGWTPRLVARRGPSATSGCTGVT